MSTNNYITAKKAKQILGVHIQTLYNWERKGLIDTIRTTGGQRRYNVEKYLSQYVKPIEKEKEKEKNDKSKLNICYVRVSTLSQKDDIERQKKYMINKYPTFIVIEDIGSGINFNRRGLRKIIKLAISGKIQKLVVAYKDRLTRFGFGLIEDLIKDKFIF